MSLKDCIINGREEGVINDEQQRFATDLFEELADEYRQRGDMTPQEAESLAGRDTFDALKAEATERARRSLLQLQAWKTIEKEIDAYAAGPAGSALMARHYTPTGRAALAILERDFLYRGKSVESVKWAIRGQAYARMEGVLAEHTRRLTGAVRNRAGLKNLVRELFDEDTGDISARELADAWRSSSEYLRVRFNRAGGRIGHRRDYGLPQMHDMLEVRKAGYEEWRNYILPRLAPDRMIDELTGTGFSPARLELALRNAYSNITTDGLVSLRPGAEFRGSSLANRRQDHRFFVFRDADSWIEYQQRFGNSDAYSTMMSHVDTMSRDIALMEVLGPNPAAAIKGLQAKIRRDAAVGPDTTGKTIERANTDANRLNAVYLQLTAGVNAPVDGRVASFLAGSRQVVQSAFLGAATLSAVTDVNFARIAARMAGVPYVRYVEEFTQQLASIPRRGERARLALRIGIVVEHWTQVASAQARYVGDVSGPEVTRRVADVVMRGTGLSPWTQAGRSAFGLAFLGELAENAGKRYGSLHPHMRETMDRYGIGAEQWEIIRRTPLHQHKKSTFLRPDDLNARTDLAPDLADDLATRMLSMVNGETAKAIPSSSLRGRAFMVGESRPGSLPREVVNSFLMFKSFAIAVLNNNILQQINMKSGKTGYFADFIISTALMGAVAIQLKAIAAGKDPRPMTDTKFWLAALAQSGGLGIFGDFFFADQNRFGRGIEQNIGGPLVGLLADLTRLTAGNVQQMIKGEDMNLAAEAVRFAKRYTPGSGVWYWKLALERALWDRLEEWTDPRAHRKFHQRVRSSRRDYGQDYWWEPGQSAPSRAPDLGSLTDARR